MFRIKNPYTILGYSDNQYQFTSDDSCTILDTIQHPDVYRYLKYPKRYNTPPPELANVLWRLKGSPKDGTSQLCITLVTAKKMIPTTKAEEELVNLFNQLRDYLLKRARIFYWFLERDTKRVELCHLLNPFIAQLEVKQMAQQLHLLVDFLHPHTKRVFFAFVFKFSTEHRKALRVNTGESVEAWQLKKRRRPRDPLYALYFQASNALWDYVEFLELECVVTATNSKSKQCLTRHKFKETWIEWCRDKGEYTDFVSFVENAHTHSDNRRIAVFVEFLWESIGNRERKRIKITLL